VAMPLASVTAVRVVVSSVAGSKICTHNIVCSRGRSQINCGALGPTASRYVTECRLRCGDSSLCGCYSRLMAATCWQHCQLIGLTMQLQQHPAGHAGTHDVTSAEVFT
jgi:hypothetical protein